MRAAWVRCRAEASYSQGGCAHLRVVDVFRRFRHGRNGLRVPKSVRDMLLCAAPSRCLVVVGGLLAGHAVRQTSSVAGAWRSRMSSELRASRSRALLSGRTSSVHMQRRDTMRGAYLRKAQVSQVRMLCGGKTHTALKARVWVDSTGRGRAARS